MPQIVDIEFLNWSFYGNSARSWVAAACVFAAVILSYYLLKTLVIRKLHKLAQATHTKFDDYVAELVGETKAILILAIALWGGSLALDHPPKIESLIETIAFAALFLQLALWGNGFIGFWVQREVDRKRAQDAASVSAFGAIGFFARIALWSLLILLFLNNLGFDVTTLVAGLGVGGIAIALAVQNVLGDVFCSVSILLDKPFEVGDFIIVGDKSGIVDQIGIKSTRIKSLQGEQIVIANSDLVASRIQNFKRMLERRIVFTVGLTYQTPADKVEAVPGMIKEIVESDEMLRFDRCHFKSFGDFSLDVETVYYVTNREYLDYMNAQERINLALMRRFEKEGIEFAYPTQTLFVEKTA